MPANTSPAGTEGVGWLKKLAGALKRPASEPQLVTEAPRRVVVARLPSRYLVDQDVSLSVAHTYGLVRFTIHEVVLDEAVKNRDYFCTASIGRQSWATKDARALSPASASLRYEQGSEFVLQKGGATVIRLGAFRQGALEGALSNRLDAWCEVDLATYFSQAEDAGAAAAGGNGASYTALREPYYLSRMVLSGDFDLVDPGDTAVIRGKVRISARTSSLQELEQQVWNRLLLLADFDGNGRLCEGEVGALLRAFGADMPQEELHSLFAQADSNGDGGVDVDELAKLLAFGGGQHSQFQKLVKMCPVDGALLSSEDAASNLIYVALALSAAEPRGGEGDMRAGYLSQAQASRSWLLHLSEWAAHPLSGRSGSRQPGALRVGKAAAHCLVFDRRRKMVVEETLSPVLNLAMRQVYQSRAGKALLRQGLANKGLVALSVREGRNRDSPESAAEIQPFVNSFRGEINVEEAERPLSQYKTFNEFFYRKLKPGARPVAAPANDDVIVSAADCRLHVFENVNDATRFWIKGKNFSIAGLLGDTDPAQALAATYAGGTMAIFRLAPQDYHRFHSPVAGVLAGPARRIPGGLFTVNPIAVNSALCDVFTDNKREVVTVETKEYGSVAFVAIGATLVGSIFWTAGSAAGQGTSMGTGASPAVVVAKGEELGYFSFGGSTCIVLFPDGKVTWDADLLANSKKSLETLVQVGERIGARRDSPAQGQPEERDAQRKSTVQLTEDAGVLPLDERPDMQSLLDDGQRGSQPALTSLLDAATIADV